MNFAECNPITECTDALIAAGIGDVKDLQTQVNALEYSNLFLQAGYDSIEKDRQYWIGKYKAEEKRADIAEQALLTACAKMVKDEKDDINIELLVGVIYKKYLEQAEKELAEDRKDENN